MNSLVGKGDRDIGRQMEPVVDIIKRRKLKC